VPHLAVVVREAGLVVGPLVPPGGRPCLRCLDLHRTDRDPAWPSIAAQLSGTASQTTMPCDVVLATTVASHAALQVLAFLDGDRDGSARDRLPTVDGTLEIARADGRVRRRSWSRHPLCGCSWPGDRPSG
jgi:bacteriocin biosynthesis cyclodehydratase domain-containing protein